MSARCARTTDGTTHFFLRNMNQTTELTGRLVIIDRSQNSNGKINVLNGVVCVPSNVRFSNQEGCKTTKQ